MATEVGEIKASIRSLVNERRELRERLLRGRNRGANAFRGIKRSPPETPTEGASDIKRPRLGLPNGANGPEVVPTMFPVEKRPAVQLDDSTVKRNRNLFGSLLGHLQKAKTKLDDEKTTRAAELQKSVEEQVVHKLELERKNLAELKRRDFQERQLKDLARMRELQREIILNENKMLSLTLQRHFNRMKSFVSTDTAPMIFWSPAVHNDKSKELQARAQRQIEAKLESLLEKFDQENAMLSELNFEGPAGQRNSAVPSPVAEPQGPVGGVHPGLMDDDIEDEVHFKEDLELDKGEIHNQGETAEIDRLGEEGETRTAETAFECGAVEGSAVEGDVGKEREAAPSVAEDHTEQPDRQTDASGSREQGTSSLSLEAAQACEASP